MDAVRNLKSWRSWAALVAVLYFSIAQMLAVAHARSLEAIAPDHDPACAWCVVGERNGGPPASAPSPPEAPLADAPAILAVESSVEAFAVNAAQPRAPPSR
jgi:hypothetical protein